MANAIQDDDELLTTDDLCRLLRIGRSTAERWRTIGGDQYPPFTKYPGKRGRVTYSKRAVQQWILRRQRFSTSQSDSN